MVKRPVRDDSAVYFDSDHSFWRFARSRVANDLLADAKARERVLEVVAGVTQKLTLRLRSAADLAPIKMLAAGNGCAAESAQAALDDGGDVVLLPGLGLF